MKHTPGPWIFYADTPSTDPNWHIVTTANRMRVLANVHIEPGNEMDEANARLIAAAPELLVALADCVAVMGNEMKGLSVIQPELRQARAAIAKATNTGENNV